MKNTPNSPKTENGLIQMIMIRKSNRQKGVKHNVIANMYGVPNRSKATGLWRDHEPTFYVRLRFKWYFPMGFPPEKFDRCIKFDCVTGFTHFSNVYCLAVQASFYSDVVECFLCT